MSANLIPGTDYRLPTDWDLLQTGLDTPSYILDRYGPEAYACWEAAGRPQWKSTTWQPSPEFGIIRRGWHQGRSLRPLEHPAVT